MTLCRILLYFCFLPILLLSSIAFPQNVKQQETGLLQLINQEKDLSKRNTYIDSLLHVFDKQEKSGVYDQKNDIIRATFLFRSSSPNPLKIDTLLSRAIAKYESTVGDAILLQYCANLNNCLLIAPADKNSIYKEYMLQFSYKVTSWKNQQNFAERTLSTIALYQKQILATCSDYALASEAWLKHLPSIKTQKGEVLHFLMKELERKACTQQNAYENVLDSLISAQPETDLWIKKSKVQAKKEDYKSEYKSLLMAKTLCQTIPLRDSIHFMLVENRFKCKENKEVVSLSNEENTTFKDTILLLAAQAILRNKETCSKDAFETKVNCLYAFQLLQKADQKNSAIKEFSAILEKELPSREELLQNGFRPGDNFYIKCLDFTIQLQ